MEVGIGSLGLSINEFWLMRPKDLFIKIRGWKKIREDNQELQVRIGRKIAWFVYKFGGMGTDGNLKEEQIWSLKSDSEIEKDNFVMPSQEELKRIDSILSNLQKL